MSFENSITINGVEYSFEPGETILQIARRNSIDIPTLCYLKGASPTGACRMCVVEVEGAKALVVACAMPAARNMVVKTESKRVVEARRLNLELLISSGNHNCRVEGLGAKGVTDSGLKTTASDEQKDLCPAYGQCRLQELGIRYNVKVDRFPVSESRHKVEDVNPFIIRDLARCILCGRCVQACNDIQVNRAISFGYRGADSKIIAKGDGPLMGSDCIFCGECLQACPVGALVGKDEMRYCDSDSEVKKVRTTCSYCGVGCQMHLYTKDNRVVKVAGVEDVGPNYGSLCSKGRFGFQFINDERRLRHPMIREGNSFREATWDEALDLVASRLSPIKKEHGPDSIGVFSSARTTNEENYLAQKFTRTTIGTNNIDHCARL